MLIIRDWYQQICRRVFYLLWRYCSASNLCYPGAKINGNEKKISANIISSANFFRLFSCVANFEAKSCVSILERIRNFGIWFLAVYVVLTATCATFCSTTEPWIYRLVKWPHRLLSNWMRMRVIQIIEKRITFAQLMLMRIEK